MGGLPGLCGVIKDQSAAHRQQDFGGGGLLHVLPACFPWFRGGVYLKGFSLPRNQGKFIASLLQVCMDSGLVETRDFPLSTWTRLPLADFSASPNTRRGDLSRFPFLAFFNFLSYHHMQDRSNIL